MLFNISPLLFRIALKFTSKKKKKKALQQIFDNSDIEKTPPPSPTEGDGITVSLI